LQAVSTVSELISRGSFDELEGLVTREVCTSFSVMSYLFLTLWISYCMANAQQASKWTVSG